MTLRLLLLMPVLALCLTAPAVRAQSVEERRQAVETTLDQSPVCARMGDLYWEIGNSDGRLASGQRGTAVNATRRQPLGAASKWLLAAYVAERRDGKLGLAEIAALNMTSGFSRLNVIACRGAGTVSDCPSPGPNPQHRGRFFYNNGHAQHLAMVMGLGAMGPRELRREIGDVLGLGDALDYSSPQPGGSAELSPAAYGEFLRGLIDNRWQLSPLLGTHAVCTLCLEGLYSPSPKDWHYSLGHWVEDAPGDDGALSSPGLTGFYPWISADHVHWGILARNHLSKDAWYASAKCGALMRRAWLTARAQF